MRKEVKERENEKGSQRTGEQERKLKDRGKRKEVKGQGERGRRFKDQGSRKEGKGQQKEKGSLWTKKQERRIKKVKNAHVEGPRKRFISPKLRRKWNRKCLMFK